MRNCEDSFRSKRCFSVCQHGGWCPGSEGRPGRITRIGVSLWVVYELCVFRCPYPPLFFLSSTCGPTAQVLGLNEKLKNAESLKGEDLSRCVLTMDVHYFR